MTVDPLGFVSDQADPMREDVPFNDNTLGGCGTVAVYPYMKKIRVDLIILHS